jgi:sterol desaturase/sphingolipid hydroxylase (fatty acid hydroxylase superfamily)
VANNRSVSTGRSGDAMKEKPTFWLVRGAALVAAFGALALIESLRPLRRRVESRRRRSIRNAGIATIAAAALAISERPIIGPLATMVERRRLGLLPMLRLPKLAERVLALILLDYTIYIWHVLLHHVPLLWRVHLPHHIDRDLDTSTALRFHALELVSSLPWRAGQVVVIGVTPSTLTLWQSLLMLSVMFHHSNIALPIRVERWISRFIVTPRMHGIHHSTIEEETSSNWSSGLTIWDRLHGTFRLDVPQQEITIGVPAYQSPEDLRFSRVMLMPLREQRPSWILRDGSRPRRAPNAIGPARLLA